jgi:hypothetical protein
MANQVEVIDYFTPADDNTEDAIDLNSLSGENAPVYQIQTDNFSENTSSAQSEVQDAQSA